MSLLELRKILGERIRIAGNTEMSPEERCKENQMSDTIAKLAKQTISISNTMLRGEELISGGKVDESVIAKIIR